MPSPINGFQAGPNVFKKRFSRTKRQEPLLALPERVSVSLTETAVEEPKAFEPAKTPSVYRGKIQVVGKGPIRPKTLERAILTFAKPYNIPYKMLPKVVWDEKAEHLGDDKIASYTPGTNTVWINPKSLPGATMNVLRHEFQHFLRFLSIALLSPTNIDLEVRNYFYDEAMDNKLSHVPLLARVPWKKDSAYPVPSEVSQKNPKFQQLMFNVFSYPERYMDNTAQLTPQALQECRALDDEEWMNNPDGFRFAQYLKAMALRLGTSLLRMTRIARLPAAWNTLPYFTESHPEFKTVLRMVDEHLACLTGNQLIVQKKETSYKSAPLYTFNGEEAIAHIAPERIIQSFFDQLDAAHKAGTVSLSQAAQELLNQIDDASCKRELLFDSGKQIVSKEGHLKKHKDLIRFINTYWYLHNQNADISGMMVHYYFASPTERTDIRRDVRKGRYEAQLKPAGVAPMFQVLNAMDTLMAKGQLSIPNAAILCEPKKPAEEGTDKTT